MHDDRNDGLAWLIGQSNKVAELEAAADVAAARHDFVTAAANIAEADDLREKLNQPRERFASLREMFAELETLAALARGWDADEPLSSGSAIRALRELGGRASDVGLAIESLADDLDPDDDYA